MPTPSRAALSAQDAESIPVFTSLRDVVVPAALEAQERRLQALLGRFEEQHGVPAAFVARAPGRVNVLGEHIDYCGYGVMPCSIELDVLMACAVEDASADSSSTIDLRNVDSGRYPDERFTFKGDASSLEIDDRQLLWHNYFRAGLKGVLAHAARGSAPRALTIRVTCDGTVPAEWIRRPRSTASAVICSTCASAASRAV